MEDDLFFGNKLIIRKIGIAAEAESENEFFSIFQDFRKRSLSFETSETDVFLKFKGLSIFKNIVLLLPVIFGNISE